MDQRASLGNDRVPAPSGFSARSHSLHIPYPGTGSCLPAEPLPAAWHRVCPGTIRWLGFFFGGEECKTDGRRQPLTGGTFPPSRSLVGFCALPGPASETLSRPQRLPPLPTPSSPETDRNVRTYSSAPFSVPAGSPLGAGRLQGGWGSGVRAVPPSWDPAVPNPAEAGGR